MMGQDVSLDSPGKEETTRGWNNVLKKLLEVLKQRGYIPLK